MTRCPWCGDTHADHVHGVHLALAHPAHGPTAPVAEDRSNRANGVKVQPRPAIPLGDEP